jgi:hypothetical protein
MRNLRNSPRHRRFPFPLDLALRTLAILLRPVLQQPFAFERLSSSEVALGLKIEAGQRWKNAHGQPVRVEPT